MIIRIDTQKKEMYITDVSDEEVIMKTLVALFDKEVYKEYEAFLTTSEYMRSLNAAKKN